MIARVLRCTNPCADQYRMLFVSIESLTFLYCALNQDPTELGYYFPQARVHLCVLPLSESLIFSYCMEGWMKNCMRD